MMNKYIRQLGVVGLLGVLAAISSFSFAQDVDPAVEKKITERLQKARADLKIQNLEATPLEGIYQAQVVNGPTIYVTADGRHFIAGDLYQVDAGQMVNLTEAGRNAERKEALAQISKDDMIVFAPEGKAKAHITVFTDIDCGYCRKLHQEVPALNDMGVEVRYMGFPRAGVNSNSYQKLATAFCADNSQETLTRLKQGESVPNKVCSDNPVAEQYQLGQDLGVTATPALVLESGELLLGYLPAAQLAERLGL